MGHARKFGRDRAKDRKEGGLNEFQQDVLKAAHLVGMFLSPFNCSDVIGCMRANGTNITIKAGGCVGASLKALSERGHIRRLPSGDYERLDMVKPNLSPPASKIPPSGLAPLRKSDLTAGRAPIARRRTVNLEQPLWPEDASQ